RSDSVHRPGVRGSKPGRRHPPGCHRPEDPAAMIEAPSTLPTSDARLPRGQALRRGLGANPLLLVGGLLSALIVVIALLALALAAVLPTSVTTVIIVIALTWWPWYTRLIRGQAASVAGRPYIDSCRALGISRRRIIFRHILPNSITPLIIQVSLDVGGGS